MKPKEPKEHKHSDVTDSATVGKCECVYNNMHVIFFQLNERVDSSLFLTVITAKKAPAVLL